MSTPPGVSPTDHGWVDDGCGVLSCIAGDLHTATTIVACPYYLRRDVLDALPASARPRWRSDMTRSLTYQGDPYYKVTQVARPHEWRTLVTALPRCHGATPAAWSLFSLLDRRPGMRILDPRQALADRLHGAPTSSRTARALRELLAGLGDRHDNRGLLGLTGSAALDPAKLDTGADLDLLVYPPATTAALAPILATLGARFLGELPDTDPRIQDYRGSRIMAPLTEPATRLRLLRRRRDVCWIDGLRLDLTDAAGQDVVAESLHYERAPADTTTATVEVTGVSVGYPTVIAVRGGLADRLLITARGYSTGVLRAGDVLELRCSWHVDGQSTFLSLDDAAGHSLRLLDREDHRC